MKLYQPHFSFPVGPSKPEGDDVILDIRGNQVIPEKGAVIRRKAKAWKVVMVAQASATKDNPIPVITVLLTQLR
ncbi:MAG: hypothetical protein WAK24_22660 [Candidatus Acidiferrales bacterium]